MKKGKSRNKYEILCNCDGRANGVSIIEITRGKNKTKSREIRVVKHIPSGTPKEEKLSVCLAPIFGVFGYWLLLLQFVEWHRLLGVEKIFAYYQHNRNVPGLNVLEYYSKKTSLLELITVPQHGDCATNHYCRHEFQLQDCMYRSRYNGYRFVSPIDIDEVLLPLNHSTLLGYIK